MAPISLVKRINGRFMATQKVRVKVLIGPSGDYCAYGWQGASDKDPDDTIYEVITEFGAREYWLTADVPIPNADTSEIQAVIE